MIRPLAASAAVVALGACSDTNTSTEFERNPDPTATANSFELVADGSGAVSFTGFDGTGQVFGGNDVSFVNLDTGVITSGEFAGFLNASRTEIALTAGGTVFLSNPGGTEYVRFFERADVPILGVVGFVTDPLDMPTTGGSRYEGAGSVIATDSRALYNLSGTAVVIADFGGGTVDIELDSLSGIRRDVSGDRPVSDGGTILVEGGVIVGSSFNGGSAFAIGAPFDFSGNQDARDTNGAFFGPDADEVAGRIVVDDPDADVQVLGRFVTD